MDLYARSALTPGLAMIAIGGSLIALVAGAIVGFKRARRRDALAATAEASIGDRPPPLVEGSDVVLWGIVRHFENHQVAVKVSVTQHGSESESSGSWSHSWTEIDREITLAPFLLELPGGQHVLVTPPKNVDVADDLDQKVWVNRNHRVLSAELVPGERIFARGRLERSDQAQATAGGAYRDVAWGWALTPTKGQMLLSSEPLGRGMRQRAQFHRNIAFMALGLLIITQLSLARFYGRVLGHTEEATVIDKSYQETKDSDGHTNSYYTIDVSGILVEGETIEIGSSSYGWVQNGMTVPIRVANRGNWNLGAWPTLHWWHALLIAIAGCGFWIRYRSQRVSSRPWFRRKVTHSGAGKLPDSG